MLYSIISLAIDITIVASHWAVVVYNTILIAIPCYAGTGVLFEDGASRKYPTARIHQQVTKTNGRNLTLRHAELSLRARVPETPILFPFPGHTSCSLACVYLGMVVQCEHRGRLSCY